MLMSLCAMYTSSDLDCLISRECEKDSAGPGMLLFLCVMYGASDLDCLSSNCSTVKEVCCGRSAVGAGV